MKKIVASGVAVDTAERTVSGDVTNGTEPLREERVVKLTAKALAEKCDRFQVDRKAKLNIAASLRNSIRGFMVKNEVTNVQNGLIELLHVCNEAKCVHANLLGFISPDEKEKQETWFKAKMIPNNECISETEMWVSNNVVDDDENEEGNDVHNEIATNENNVNEINGTTNEGGGHLIDDGIRPNDSVSNVGSRHSKGSAKSDRSSTASAKLIAEADRAALVARAAALKEQHALEEEEQLLKEQQQRLRRKREQLAVEAELAANNAKMIVLHAGSKGSSHVSSRGSKSNVMNSYLKRGIREKVNVLNPNAKQFQPGTSKQSNKPTQPTMPPIKPPDVRPKGFGQWNAATPQPVLQYNHKEQQHKMETLQHVKGHVQINHVQTNQINHVQTNQINHVQPKQPATLY